MFWPIWKRCYSKLNCMSSLLGDFYFWGQSRRIKHEHWAMVCPCAIYKCLYMRVYTLNRELGVLTLLKRYGVHWFSIVCIWNNFVPVVARKNICCFLCAKDVGSLPDSYSRVNLFSPALCWTLYSPLCSKSYANTCSVSSQREMIPQSPFN